MNSRTQAILLLICSLLIFLFVYTASSKLLTLHSFQAILSKSPLIGDKAYILAISIPLIEMIVAGLLIFPGTRYAGLIGSFSLMTLFTGYISYMLLFASSLPCSCGGVIGSMSWQTHLVFNCLFIGLSALGIRLLKKPTPNFHLITQKIT